MQEALGKCWISQLFSCSFCLFWTLFNKSNQATPPPPLYPETTAHLWSLGRPPRRDNYNRVIHLSGSETSERDCFPCGDAAARVKSD